MDDYLVPYLADLEFPESLSPGDFEDIVASCLQDFKGRRTNVMNLIKEHQKKVEQLPEPLLPAGTIYET